LFDKSYDGQTFCNVISLRNSASKTTDAHELIHTHQYTSSSTISTFLRNEYPNYDSLMKKSEKNYNLKLDSLVGSSIFMGIPNITMPYLDRPHEIEAYVLTEGIDGYKQRRK